MDASWLMTRIMVSSFSHSAGLRFGSKVRKIPASLARFIRQKDASLALSDSAGGMPVTCISSTSVKSSASISAFEMWEAAEPFL